MYPKRIVSILLVGLLAGTLAACSLLTTAPTASPPSATIRLPTPTLALPTATAPAAAPATSPTPTTRVMSPTPAPPTRAPATPASKPATATVRPAGDLRALDWSRVIANDPTLDHPLVPDFGINLGPYVEVRTTGGPGPAGYAMTQASEIVFADLDGDGKEEAVIQLFSGGTAGSIGLLVYRWRDGQPLLVTYMAGYKLRLWTDGGQLVVREPVYAGWEANCCPSGFSETRYRLQADTLVQLSRTDGGNAEARSLTVEEFYSRLDRKQYREAYSFLSPSFQAANPFATWSAGYANTLSIAAAISDLPDGRVGVVLTATDRTASGEVTRTWKGDWRLVWSSGARQWLLDQANIVASP